MDCCSQHVTGCCYADTRFFSLNRAYLLLSTLMSLLLPLVNLSPQTVETMPRLDWPVPVGVIVLPVTALAATPIETGLHWEQIGLVVYSLIALFLVGRFSVQVGRLLQLIRRSPRQVRQGYVRVQPSDPTIPTFSFFQYVILNRVDIHNDLIIRHELVHVRQHHSIDVVGLALFKAVFWACPALWLIDRMLRQVHEFLADKQTNQASDYARFLVEYTFGVRPDTLTNGFFNPPLLKQRILMLHQKATNHWALSKYALVLPLTFGLLAMTTARKEIAEIVGQATDGPITVSGRVTISDGRPASDVFIMDGKRLSRTDQKGYYWITGLQNPSTLMFSHTGFKAVTNKITHTTKLNITLQSISEELPTMGATAVYKAIKPNLTMPVRTPPSTETINGKVYTAVEEPAVFPTGIPGLMQYVAHTLRYPAKAQAAGVQGNVFVQFMVLPTGAIGSAKIKRGIGSGCDEEALRIVKHMPRWIPGKQNGKAVSAQYVIPIQFALDKSIDKQTGQVDPSIFKPTGSPIGEFPTARDVNYPNQPRLMTTTRNVPAGFFKSDTTPQPKTNDFIDDGKNGHFALYNDVKPKLYPLPDSLKQKQDKRIWLHNPNAKPPLLILDGVEISDEKLKTLSPNDIESLNVYKDGSAYGEKGKNGVVIITSKKK